MKNIIIYLFLLLLIYYSDKSYSQWQTDVRLTNDTSRSSVSGNGAWYVAANGETVHVVWYDKRDGNWEIYYKRSTNSGSNWGNDTKITNNDSSSAFPSVCVNGLAVHIVWQDERNGNDEIYYKRSQDAGVSWGADTRLTNNSNISESPSVTVSGLNVLVVWEDRRDGNKEIYFKRSSDGGSSWGSDTRLTNNTEDSEKPSISVSGENVHVLWSDRRDGNDEIYYKRSTNSGVSWQADIRLTNYILFSGYVSVWATGSFVHCTWQESRDGNYEIYYKRSTDAGGNWGPDKQLTIQEDDQQLPSITSSGSNVHIVYFDNRNSNPEIYYTRSTDNGSNWSPETRLTNNVAYSYYPSVAVGGSFVHVVWRENRDGNDEIYYKRNPTGNPFGIKKISSEVPVEFSLSQNYPNPFNPGTKIKFDIGSDSRFRGNDNVTLKIFDILGREVVTLVNEQLQPGTYEADFDGSNYTSGVYFYELTAGEFRDTKKMIIIK